MGAYTKLGVLSDGETIAAAAYSENFIDLEVAKTHVGVGGDVWLCIRTNTIPGTLADTYGVELHCSATNDGTDLNGTIRCVMTVGNATTAIEVAATSDTRYNKAGAFIFRGTLPYECNLRYVQLYYNNTTSNGTGAAFDAWLQTEPPKSDPTQIYASPVGNP